MNEPPPSAPPGNPVAGKLIALGLPLVIVAVTAVVGVWFSQRDRRHREGRVEGPDLYRKHCAECHGDMAQGATAPGLRPMTAEIEAFQAALQQGLHAQRLEKKLFDSDHERLLRYLKSLDAK